MILLSDGSRTEGGLEGEEGHLHRYGLWLDYSNCKIKFYTGKLMSAFSCMKAIGVLVFDPEYRGLTNYQRSDTVSVIVTDPGHLSS